MRGQRPCASTFEPHAAAEMVGSLGCWCCTLLATRRCARCARVVLADACCATVEMPTMTMTRTRIVEGRVRRGYLPLTPSASDRAARDLRPRGPHADGGGGGKWRALASHEPKARRRGWRERFEPGTWPCFSVRPCCGRAECTACPVVWCWCECIVYGGRHSGGLRVVWGGGIPWHLC